MGNVYGAQQIKANMVVLKAAVANGEAETDAFLSRTGWWPHPGGKLSVDDTMLNKSAVGRYVTVADPDLAPRLALPIKTGSRYRLACGAKWAPSCSRSAPCPL